MHRRRSSTGILGIENGKAQGFQAWEMEWVAQGFPNMGIERHGALSMGQGVIHTGVPGMETGVTQSTNGTEVPGNLEQGAVAGPGDLGIELGVALDQLVAKE
jgi:hypothetical protein